MASFRILDQDPVYFDLQGNLANGGHLRFYESGTTTPKSVYADESLSVSNGAEVLIGSDGRATVDIWGDGLGPYRVRLYDANETLITERDDVDLPGGSGSALPSQTGHAGEALFTDGANPAWAEVLQVPDPTGQSGKILGNNGTIPIWQTLVTNSANAVLTFVTGGVKISNGTTAFMVQFGSDTVPAAGSSPVSAKSFSFGTAFTDIPRVFATINGTAGVANPSGGIPTFGVNSVSTTGAMMNIDTNAFGSTINVINPVPFVWYAIGSVAA
jgi:hypothetical protein